MRLRLVIRGTVQRVGFRPFVHRTARALGLTGWVRNTRDAVHVELQGDDDAVRSFMRAFEHRVEPARVLNRLALEEDGVDESKRRAVERVPQQRRGVPAGERIDHDHDLVVAKEEVLRLARELHRAAQRWRSVARVHCEKAVLLRKKNRDPALDADEVWTLGRRRCGVIARLARADRP